MANDAAAILASCHRGPCAADLAMAHASAGSHCGYLDHQTWEPGHREGGHATLYRLRRGDQRLGTGEANAAVRDSQDREDRALTILRAILLCRRAGDRREEEGTRNPVRRQFE